MVEDEVTAVEVADDEESNEYIGEIGGDGGKPKIKRRRGNTLEK